MTGIGQYIKETRGELRHVAWPTRTQTIVYTVVVAILSILVAFYLGVFDYAFSKGINLLIESTPVQTSPIDVQEIPLTPEEMQPIE